jgi:hypothetical protein
MGSKAVGDCGVVTEGRLQPTSQYLGLNLVSISDKTGRHRHDQVFLSEIASYLA